MEAILLNFKVFITRDFNGVEREYSDIMLNPKQIVCVREEKDYKNKPYSIIEFDSQQTTRERKSPIIEYTTEENMHSILNRVNSRQVLETGIAPISMPNAYLSDD